MVDCVGRLGALGSAVYLGQKWILTANHAFEARTGDVVTFAGRDYRILPKRAVRLKNPAGSRLASDTDLLMVPLRSAPDLPALIINKKTPFAAERVVLVGCGQAGEGARGKILTEAQPGKRVSPVPISDRKNSTELKSRVRWGENEISDRGLVVGIPGDDGQTQAFATVRQSYPTEYNAQGARGDSGGGVFVKRGDKWQLSGIMLSIVKLNDRGASGTFIADLSAYRQQIEATIPEPSGVALVLAAGLMFGMQRRRR